MKKLIIVISILTLILALFIVGASLMNRNKELKDSQIAISNLEFDLNSCKVIYNDLLNNKQTINNLLEEKIKFAEELSMQIESLENELIIAEENNLLQREEIESLRLQIQSLQEQLDNANAEISSLKEQSNVIDDRILSYIAIITGSDYEGDFIIPEGVVSIKANAFSQLTNIKGRLILPSTLTTIGKNAFYKCNISGELVIPDSVIEIGVSAFEYCSNLTSVKIGLGMKSLDNGVFSHCKNIESFVFPDNSFTFYYTSYTYCSSLKEINFPKSTRQISASAFGYCSNIETFNILGENSIYEVVNNCVVDKRTNTLVLGCKNSIISNSINVIGPSSFLGCSNLLNIDIPVSVVEIGALAFGGCSSLTSFNIPGSVSNLGTQVFQDCVGLTSIIIPDSINSIGISLFSGCSNLNNVYIGSGVVSIAYTAFSKCVSLKSIYIPKNVLEIVVNGTSRPFSQCKDLVIYCEVEEPLSSWSANWNVYDKTYQLETHYGYTYEQYLEAIATE